PWPCLILPQNSARRATKPGRPASRNTCLGAQVRGRYCMRRTVGMLGLFTALALAVLAIGPAALAQGHEQVIFSGEAEGSVGEVGFWIWCAVDQSGNYDDCNGAMAFDDLHL